MFPSFPLLKSSNISFDVLSSSTLPPNIAPTKVVFIPIGKEKDVLDTVSSLKEALDPMITSSIDTSEKSPGFRFAESEVNGMPVRIEIGERDYGGFQKKIGKK